MTGDTPIDVILRLPRVGGRDPVRILKNLRNGHFYLLAGRESITLTEDEAKSVCGALRRSFNG